MGQYRRAKLRSRIGGGGAVIRRRGISRRRRSERQTFKRVEWAQDI